MANCIQRLHVRMHTYTHALACAKNAYLRGQCVIPTTKALVQALVLWQISNLPEAVHISAVKVW